MKQFILSLFSLLLTAVHAGYNLFPGDSSAEAEADSLINGIHTQVRLAEADDKDAVDGKRSILINWNGIEQVVYAKKSDSAGYLNRTVCTTPTLPLEAGKKYVCSFYAKAEKPGMVITASALPDGEAWQYEPGAKVSQKLQLSTQWQRYEIKFTANFRKRTKLRTYALMLDFTGCIPGKVRLDAVQFEEGSTARKYINAAPVTAGSTVYADSPAKIFTAGKPVSGNLRVAVHQPGTAAKISAVLSDYRGNKVKQWQVPCAAGTYPFTLDAVDPGWYKLRTTVYRGNKAIFSHDTNFISVVPPEKLAAGIRPYLGICGGDPAEQAKIGTRRFQIPFYWYNSRWGVENTRGKIDWTNFRLRITEAKKHGFSVKVNVNVYSTPPWFYTGSEAKSSNRVPPPESHKDWFSLLGKLLNEFGSMIDEIEFGAEDNGRLGLNSYYMKKYPDGVERDAGGQGWLVAGKAFNDLMNFEKLACLEVRRLAPHIRTSVLRPSQGLPADHWLFVRKALEKIGRGPVCFGLDTYAAIPFYYGPDIKSNNGSTDDRFETIRRAEKWLKKYTGASEIFMSECGTAVDTRCADDGPYRIRQCEQMARDLITSRCAGFYAFDWFLGINYFPCLSHTPYCFSMIHNGRIQSIAAVYSAAGHILENVTQSKFFTPDETTRIAVFKKADGSATAAVWGENGTSADLSGLTLTDIMGKKVKAGKIALSASPLYIRHQNFDTLLNRMKNLKLNIASPCQLYFAPAGKNSLVIRFVNRMKNTDFASDIKITENGISKRCHLAIPGGAILHRKVKLSGPDRRIEVLLSGKKFSYTVPEVKSIPYGTIRKAVLDSVTEQTKLLPADPWIPWNGPDDFSYKLLASWDKNDLHVCVEVKDDMHFPGSSPWSGDGMQLAVDASGDSSFLLRHNADDLEIGMTLSKHGPKLIRSIGKAEIKKFNAVRDESRKLTIYTFSLPWKELGVIPAAGQMIGISTVVFDDDRGKGMEYYGRTGGGITVVKRPDMYDKFILEEKQK